MFPIPFNKPYRNPDGTLTTIGEVIASGGGGGGTDGVYVGETDPDNEVGEDGDFYLKVRNIYTDIPLISPQNSNTNMVYSEEWTSGNGYAWHLCDASGSTYWSTREGYNTNQYCGFDFGANGAVVANRVGINPRAWSNVVQIHDFKIQASNDNTSWVDLYSGEIPNDVSYAERMNYFDFENETAYRYYRLYVIDANTSRTITVFEMQLYYYDETEVFNLEVVDTYKKINSEWVNSVGGYEIKTHSTSGSDASMDVFIMVYGVLMYYKTILYNGDSYTDSNISLRYINNVGWKLTPLVTMYDENGDEVTEQTWVYGTSKDFIWYLNDPTE